MPPLILYTSEYVILKINSDKLVILKFETNKNYQIHKEDAAP
jgi:hypothetical protein